MEDGETLAPSVQEPGVASDFSGSLRLRLADVRPLSDTFNGAPPELRHTPYASERVRLGWKDRVEAGESALRPSPGPSLTARDLSRNGTVKYFVALPDNALVGNYSLSFGQGLMFYDHLGEFVRPSWVQGRGAAPDLSSGRGDYLRGGFLQGKLGIWTMSGFSSRLGLDLPLGPDGQAAKDLWSLRAGAAPDPQDMGTVEERVEGARLEARSGENHLGFTAAGFRYAPGVDPPSRSFSDGRIFRGEKNEVAGVDASMAWEGSRVALDAARSHGGGRRGNAAAGTLFQEGDGARVWASLFSYGEGYFARHGKGPAFDVDDLPTSLPANQKGLSLGARGGGRWGYAEGESVWVSFPAAQGDGRNEDPVFSSQGRRWRAETGLTFSPDWDGLLRFQERTRDRSLTPPGGLSRAQGQEIVRRMRVETSWKASASARFRMRYDVRWERTPFVGRRAEGRLIMGEVLWRPEGVWSLSGRCYAFQSPEASLTSGVEEIWDGVVSPLVPGGMGNFQGASGERYVLVFRRRWGEGLRSWISWGENRRWRGASVRDDRRSWRLQTDFSW